MMNDNREVFNAMSQNWDDTSRLDLVRLELMCNLIGIKRGDKLLDVGCGTGVLVPYLCALTNESFITCIDFSIGMIEVAKSKFVDREVEFICDDVLTHDFGGEGLFDHILCFSVYPHFPDKPQAIRTFHQLLKKGGHLSVMHAASRETINNIHSRTEHFQSDMLPVLDSIIGLMRHNGFREEIMIDNDVMYIASARKL
jgi:demethylmenaquinone methyltransferase/2-methoxy-6-polyprenyl-1,4-benzoquinol methylase